MNGYLDSLKGQIDQLNKRKYHKMFFSIDSIPKSKKGIKDYEEEIFQKKILEYLLKTGRRAYRSPVVMEIDFYSFQNDPPAIHTLAKCYLDLLENNKLFEIDKRKKLVYCNDRQVKALFINYHLEYHTTNTIQIKVDSFSNFLNDLKLYKRISNNDFKEVNCYNFLSEYRKEELSLNSRNEAIEKYVEFMRTSNQFLNNYGETIYESWLSMYKKEAQKEFLQNIDLSVDTIINLFQEIENITDKKYKDLFVSVREVFLKPWFSINLGIIPEKEGDNTIFKAFVKEQLKKLLEGKQRLLFPLCTQLCVTIILVRPQNGGIDLDNLARKIIPFVNEILQPPARLINKDEIDRINISEIKEKLINDYEQRKRLPKYSITRYQIFEVPSSQLYNDGSVLLYLGDGTDGTNIWDQVEGLIEKWYEFLGRRNIV